MTLQIKITEEKSKYVIMALQNGFDPAFFAQFAEVSRRHSKA
jgi:hypothetical protein